MCGTCGQRAARLRTPGASPRNPVLFGAKDKRPAQPATFLQAAGGKEAGAYGYVGGDGVEQAVEDGIIQLGVVAQPPAPRLVPNTSKRASGGPWYVELGGGRFQRFNSLSPADRFARSRGAKVLTQAEVDEIEGD